MSTFIQILAALPALINAIFELMVMAEAALPETGTGQNKKEYVMAAVKAMFMIADELWEKSQKVISAIVNFTAVFKFGSKLPSDV